MTRFARSTLLAQFFSLSENAERRITMLNKVMNFSKLNPNMPRLMNREVRLFKSKKPPSIGGLSLIPQRHREEKTLW